MATLLAWGRRGLAQRIERGMAIAQRLARLVEDAPELQLWAPPTTGIVVWRPRRGDLEAVRGQLGDAWASISRWTATAGWLGRGQSPSPARAARQTSPRGSLGHLSDARPGKP